MPVRRAHAKAFAAPTTAMGAGHVGLGPCLVDEDEAGGIKVRLRVEPGAPLLQDVGPILLARMGGLFFLVILWRAKNRRSVP